MVLSILWNLWGICLKNFYNIKIITSIFKNKGNCYGVDSCEKCDIELIRICMGLVNYSDVMGSIALKRYQYAKNALIASGREDIVFEELL